jgi:hypothetical protein
MTHLLLPPFFKIVYKLIYTCDDQGQIICGTKYNNKNKMLSTTENSYTYF